jgi:hypothetical protein
VFVAVGIEVVVGVVEGAARASSSSTPKHKYKVLYAMQYTACQAEPIVRRVFFPHPRRASLMRADALLGLQRPSDEEHIICSENTRQIVKACLASFGGLPTVQRFAPMLIHAIIMYVY